jgi:hypothetical protein
MPAYVLMLDQASFFGVVRVACGIRREFLPYLEMRALN